MNFKILDMILVLSFFRLMIIVECNMKATPKNTVAIVGNRMEMECRTNKNGMRLMRWSLQRSIDALPTTLYVHSMTTAAAESYQISGTGSKVYVATNHSKIFVEADDDSGSGILFSNSVELNDAAIYICTVLIGIEQIHYKAQLIVFETVPFCGSSKNWSTDTDVRDDNVLFQCNVNFKGFWAPSAEWIEHQEDRKTILTKSDGIKTETHFNSRMTSMFSRRVTSINVTTFFTCKIFFLASNSSIEAVDNTVPEYSYTWKSETISFSFVVTKEPSSGFALTADGVAAFTSTSVLLILALLVILYCRKRKHLKEKKEDCRNPTALKRTSEIYETIDEESKIDCLRGYSNLNLDQQMESGINFPIEGNGNDTINVETVEKDTDPTLT